MEELIALRQNFQLKEQPFGELAAGAWITLFEAADLFDFDASLGNAIGERFARFFRAFAARRFDFRGAGDDLKSDRLTGLRIDETMSQFTCRLLEGVPCRAPAPIATATVVAVIQRGSCAANEMIAVRASSTARTTRQLTRPLTARYEPAKKCLAPFAQCRSSEYLGAPPAAIKGRLPRSSRPWN